MEHTGVKKVLVIDVGGTNIKVSMSGQKTVTKLPSGPEMNAARMVAVVKKAAAGWKYDAVSIGYPGPVVSGRPGREPKNLAPGWVKLDYQKAFGCPVRMINDAAMQALGSYQGGRMLFLGLGTGMGSALVADGVVEPLELAHLPYRKNRTYEDYVGLRGYKRLGRSKWQAHVEKVIEMLRQALQCDYVMLGGGQTKKLKRVPPKSRLGDNSNAMLGGLRLWTGMTGKPSLVSTKTPARKKKKIAPAPAATTKKAK